MYISHDERQRSWESNLTAGYTYYILVVLVAHLLSYRMNNYVSSYGHGNWVYMPYHDILPQNSGAGPCISRSVPPLPVGQRAIVTWAGEVELCPVVLPDEVTTSFHKLQFEKKTHFTSPDSFGIRRSINADVIPSPGESAAVYHNPASCIRAKRSWPASAVMMCTRAYHALHSWAEWKWYGRCIDVCHQTLLILVTSGATYCWQTTWVERDSAGYGHVLKTSN